MVKEEPWLNKASDWFKSFDEHGYQITLNINGDDSFKTGLGSLATFLKNLLLIFWVYSRLQKLINRNDPEFIPYSISSDLSTIQNQTFKGNSFNFAIGV